MIAKLTGLRDIRLTRMHSEHGEATFVVARGLLFQRLQNTLNHTRNQLEISHLMPCLMHIREFSLDSS